MAPQECRLARSFLDALEVASWGHVAEARMSFGLLVDGLFDDAIAAD